MKITSGLLALLLVVAPGCVTNTARTATTDAPASALLLAPSAEPSRPRASYVAHSDKAMVSTAHPGATEAGLAMLRAGGNAVDAAVAASFAISVVRPQSTGIGGGGFLLRHTAKSKKVDVYDFRERAPAKATRDMYLDAKGNPAPFRYGGAEIPDASMNGHLAVGVPGLVAGLLEVHADGGRLPLAQVMAPAIKLAAEGFTVYPGLAKAIDERAEIMRRFPGTAKIFFPKGQALKAGDLLVQKDLADTLRLIAKDGRAGFYKGKVAKAIVAEMRRGHGIITQKDLDDYKVKRREPVRGTYRGFQIVSMPPPSSGGVHIIQMLNMLNEVDYGALGHGTTASTHLLAETMRRAFADRAEYLGDTDFVQVPLAGLTSPTYAKKLFATIDREHATSSANVKPGNPPAIESPSTTHLSVVDGEGNAVSTTQTVNYTFGSCVVAEGTGIVLNDEMDDFSLKPGVPNAFGLLGSQANAIAAGKTMLSSMSPTLVFAPDGRLRLVAGSPGGPRIISATLQTIINTIDFKMPLADAVHAARIHHQWYPDELRVEAGGLAPAVEAELAKMGHKIVAKGVVGDVQAIAIEDGKVVGVSDIRSEGVPLGL